MSSALSAAACSSALLLTSSSSSGTFAVAAARPRDRDLSVFPARGFVCLPPRLLPAACPLAPAPLSVADPVPLPPLPAAALPLTAPVALVMICERCFGSPCSLCQDGVLTRSAAAPAASLRLNSRDGIWQSAQQHRHINHTIASTVFRIYTMDTFCGRAVAACSSAKCSVLRARVALKFRYFKYPTSCAYEM